MAPTLRLTLTDYLDPTRWRWVLSDSRGRFLADHDVQLEPASREYGGFVDLRKYLDYLQPIHPPEAQLVELGAWIGDRVFGGLRNALWQNRASPAVAVQVVVPQAVKDLLCQRQELSRGGRALYLPARGRVGPDRGQGTGGERPAHPGRL